MSSIHRTIVEAEAKIHQDFFEAARDGNIEAFERVMAPSILTSLIKEVVLT